MPAWKAHRRLAVDGAILGRTEDDTSLDPETGAVRSTQSAEIELPADALTGLWKPENLERLARTYWTTLRRLTLGLVHVEYSERERNVVLLTRRLPLLTFAAPEYEMDGGRGIVRWRIERGVLVSSRGRDGDGYLQLEVERHDVAAGERVRLRVEVEVANYYPALSGFSRWFYVNVQSRIHVVACTYFLRRLVRRNLEVSRVGHFAGPRTPEQAPDPGSS